MTDTLINTILCPRCGSRMRFNGTYNDREKGICWIYVCDNCGYSQMYCEKIITRSG